MNLAKGAWAAQGGKPGIRVALAPCYKLANRCTVSGRITEAFVKTHLHEGFIEVNGCDLVQRLVDNGFQQGGEPVDGPIEPVFIRGTRPFLQQLWQFSPDRNCIVKEHV